jgi:8-oxo-dGTP pyrophosphatase MutT (NUDIX family)
LIHSFLRWPGYLDNTVAGGIPAGMPVFEALVKECMEEASLPEELVRAHVRAVGCISYFFRYCCSVLFFYHPLNSDSRISDRTAKGWLQPEVECVFITRTSRRPCGACADVNGVNRRYTYDMVIPPGADPTPFEPKPLDGEVERFDVRLLSFHHFR